MTIVLVSAQVCRTSVHIHFICVHKCLAFFSKRHKLGRTLFEKCEVGDCKFGVIWKRRALFFFFFFSFFLVTLQNPWERFEHLIFLSSVVSAFWENSSPPLTPLTSDFQIPCMLSPRGLFFFPPPSTPGSAFKWCINTIKQPLKFWRVDQRANKAKCFWRISETSGRMDDLAQSNQPNQMKYHNITSKPAPTATATATRSTSPVLGVSVLSHRNIVADGLKWIYFTTNRPGLVSVGNIVMFFNVHVIHG